MLFIVDYYYLLFHRRLPFFLYSITISISIISIININLLLFLFFLLFLSSSFVTRNQGHERPRDYPGIKACKIASIFKRKCRDGTGMLQKQASRQNID